MASAKPKHADAIVFIKTLSSWRHFLDHGTTATAQIGSNLFNSVRLPTMKKAHSNLFRKLAIIRSAPCVSWRGNFAISR